MRLIGLVVVLAVGLVLSPLAGEAQQARKPVRIGVLTAQSRETSTASWESFRQGLRDLGWEEREGPPRRPSRLSWSRSEILLRWASSQTWPGQAAT